MKTLAKRHIQRLQKILAALDAQEARAQERFGDRVAGSSRSSEWRDAEAIRAVLAHVTAGVRVCGSCKGNGSMFGVQCERCEGTGHDRHDQWCVGGERDGICNCGAAGVTEVPRG